MWRLAYKGPYNSQMKLLKIYSQNVLQNMCVVFYDGFYKNTDSQSFGDNKLIVYIMINIGYYT
mgnify:CR=1 FL=1